MYTQDMQMEFGGRPYNVHIEHFESTLDVVNNVRKREYVNEYLTDKLGWREGNGGTLEDLCLNGYQRDDVLNNIKAYSENVQCERVNKLRERKFDVAGGAVDVPRYLAGIPTCMRSMKHKRVKNRVINVDLHVEITGDVSEGEYETVGTALAKTILSLEKAGYGVNLMATDAYWTSGADAICVMAVDIKHSGASTNYSRMMFPLMHASFMRGVGFGWLARTKEFGGSDYGTYVESLTSKAGLTRMLGKIVKNADTVVFTVKDLVGLLRRDDESAVMDYIKAKMLELE